MYGMVMQWRKFDDDILTKSAYSDSRPSLVFDFLYHSELLM